MCDSENVVFELDPTNCFGKGVKNFASKSEANGKIMRAVSENAKKLSEIWMDGQNFESASCVSFS